MDKYIRKLVVTLRGISAKDMCTPLYLDDAMLIAESLNYLQGKLAELYDAARV